MEIQFFFIGVLVGFFIGRMKKTQQRYGNVFTYNGVYKFCGGNPIRYKGIINGKKPAVIISKSDYNDEILGNMIYYCGTFHKKVSPASPGHQSPDYPLNKYLDETKKSINIFVKMSTNNYVHIGIGKRVGKRTEKIENGRRVMVYPIVFLSGDLEKKLDELGPASPASPVRR